MMKRSLLYLLAIIMVLGSSCSVFRRTPKYGCPGDGKAVGAEKILSGEKLPKAKKFRS